MENLVSQVFRPQVVTEEFLFSYGTILVSSKESCLANTTATAAGCGMGVRREELKGLVAFVCRKVTFLYFYLFSVIKFDIWEKYILS